MDTNANAEGTLIYVDGVGVVVRRRRGIKPGTEVDNVQRSTIPLD